MKASEDITLVNDVSEANSIDCPFRVWLIQPMTLLLDANCNLINPAVTFVTNALGSWDLRVAVA